MFIPLAPLPSLPSRPHRHPNKFLRELNAPYNPTVPISLAFKQVSQQRGWKHGSKRWRKRWNSCMNSEYDRLIGSRIASLETWQELCAKVGIKETFPSINKCKKALARVHVNIVDLLDTWDTGLTPICFDNERDLAAYTALHQKYFSRGIAKQDKVLRVLLRHLL